MELCAHPHTCVCSFTPQVLQRRRTLRHGSTALQACFEVSRGSFIGVATQVFVLTMMTPVVDSLCIFARSRSAVFYGIVAAGQLLAVLHVHPVHDRILRGDGGHAEAEEPANAQGHGKRCCQPQSLPGWQVKAQTSSLGCGLQVMYTYVRLSLLTPVAVSVNGIAVQGRRVAVNHASAV